MLFARQWRDGQRISVASRSADLATALNDAGYRTAYIAKWHLGYPPYTPEKRYGFHDFIGYNNGHLYYDISYWHNEEGPSPWSTTLRS